VSARVGVVTLNFGEPARADHADVVAFLERIFSLNAGLENAEGEAARRRSRQLAEQRAPGLVEEYRAIGGSPMNAQADAHAAALERTLRARGYDARVYSAFQFTDPLPDEIIAGARADGIERLIALPVYPLCGPSTTIAALAALRDAVGRAGWDVRVDEISGWHPHPDYVRLRADGIVATVRDAGIRPGEPRATLVFSAHGTPLKYLREGSRYDRYVEENCAQVAAAAGWRDYVIGWQNHTNRPLEWTQPDIRDVIDSLDGDAVIVVPISFMHEQSETLAELDHELREAAEGRGLAFHRVRVPHEDPRFIELLADLCEPLLARTTVQTGTAGTFSGAQVPAAPVRVRCDARDVPHARSAYQACLCRGRRGAVCLNGQP